MKASVVIGSAYGDEGKGLFTDYLSSQYEKSLVVRFNGGGQAGHTVTTPCGKRHVFGHFTSNSLQEQATAYLSKHFVFNPMVYLKEKAQLLELNKIPQVFVHPESYVTTPFDMIINQLLETKRNQDRHGSCGLGFGETIERCEKEKFTLKMQNLLNLDNLEKQLINIRENYFSIRIKDLGLTTYLKEKNLDSICYSNDFLKAYMNDIETIMKEVTLSEVIPWEKNIVFEGAQGLLLDQDLGYFPHVTRSNTGLKNVIDIIKNTAIKELDVIYATRCYTTRHGAGPLSNALEQKPYEKIHDPTNIPNEYQGTMRFAYLDLSLLEDTIKRDQEKAQIPNNLKVNTYIGVSCLDQTETVAFYENKKLYTLNKDDFLNHMVKKFNCNVFYSQGPTRSTVSKIFRKE